MKESNKNNKITFYVVADPHLTYPVKSTERLSEDSINILKTTISDINLRGADFVFFLGDLIESREFGLVNLRIAYEIMNELTMSWFVIMGNHDLRYRSTLDGYQKSSFINKFNDHGPYGSTAYWSYDDPGSNLTFVGLDSPVEGYSYGEIEEEQKEWLEDTLYAIDADRRVILLSHHPLILFDDEIKNIEGMDVYLLKNHNEIRRIIEKTNKVVLTLSGHNHTCRYLHLNGVDYIGCPSINIWPTMYTKFIIDDYEFLFNYIKIKDFEKTVKSKNRIFNNDSPIVECFGSSEAAYRYYKKGQKGGRIKFT